MSIISQLEALGVDELKRVSSAIEEKLCAKPVYPAGYFVCLGFSGFVMQLEADYRWDQEKKLPLTTPSV